MWAEEKRVNQEGAIEKSSNGQKGCDGRETYSQGPSNILKKRKKSGRDLPA